MANLIELLALRETSQDHFESLLPPEAMGNAAKLAYGGCTVGVAANAAYLSAPSGFHLYSLQGNFLGPALIDRVYKVAVQRLRDTRTFVTRFVQVSQVLDNGTDRVCMTALADFQTQEPADLQTFSAPPSRQWAPPAESSTIDECGQSLIDRGLLDKRYRGPTQKSFTLGVRLFDLRYPAGSIFGEALAGFVPHIQTSQDHLPLTEKVSADWCRARATLTKENEHVSALAFLLDMATSFISLTHDHKSFLMEAEACSSLDFSIRLFSNNVNLNEWHLKEMKAVVARQGRAFNDVRIWDNKNQLVASMTQQAIMRPKPQKTNPAKI